MPVFDAFNALLPLALTETLTGDFPPPNKQGLPSYFNVEISNAGLFDGIYDGWCIRSDRPIELTTYNVSVYSSYGVIPAGILSESLPNGGAQTLEGGLPMGTFILMDCNRSTGSSIRSSLPRLAATIVISTMDQVIHLEIFSGPSGSWQVPNPSPAS